MTTETAATTSGAALAKLAETINGLTQEDRVLERARKIWEARQLVEAGKAGPAVTWKTWVADNLTLCASRVRELLRVGRAPDPVAELKELRQEKAASVAKAKKRAAGQGAARRVPENERARAEMAAWIQAANYDEVARVWERICAAAPAPEPAAKPAHTLEIPDFLRRPTEGHA